MKAARDLINIDEIGVIWSAIDALPMVSACRYYVTECPVCPVSGEIWQFPRQPFRDTSWRVVVAFYSRNGGSKMRTLVSSIVFSFSLSLSAYAQQAEVDFSDVPLSAIDSAHPKSFEAPISNIQNGSQARSIETPQSFDCNVRRTLYVDVKTITIDESGNYFGNWSTTKGKACSNPRRTLRVPRSNCVKTFIETTCRSGNSVMLAEFAITDAHVQVIPLQYHGSCNSGGRQVLIKNRDLNRKVMATVEVSSVSVPPVTTPVHLDAGETKVIGCTVVDSDARNYKVVTAEFR